MSGSKAEPFRSFSPDDPIADDVEPVEQWLQWEEQANLVGFRTSTHPLEISVAAVARSRVEVQRAARAPAAIVDRFLRGDRVLYPRHPLNRDPAVAFTQEPAVERWTGRFTSSRTLVVPATAGTGLLSLKLATDHPHPDFVQPEKTRLREEAVDAMTWVALLDRVDGLLAPDPELRIVREVLAVVVPGTEYGFLVRDLRLFTDGGHYLPALSIPWVGRQIARRHRQEFADFWGRHYARAAGRAKALLFWRCGLQLETPNPQNVLVRLDDDLHPTGTIVIRDLGDANCATDARSSERVPWTRLQDDIRPETRNSFWAFDEAGGHSVDAGTLADWNLLHDAGYFAVFAERFPELAPAPETAADAQLAHWNAVLRDPASEPAIARGFARRRSR